MNLFKEVADIKTADQLNLPTPEVEYHNIVAQPTEHQQEMVKALSERASKVHSGSVDPSQDMKKHGHYCKVCGEYKANEKFSGKGHAAHICKSCASLPPEKQAEQMTINRLLNLPWRLSKEQISWLKNRMTDKRREVRALAKEQYEMRFPPKRLEDIEDNFDFLDEDDLIE